MAAQELSLEAAEESPFHLRIHLDAVGHEHHRARFGAHDISRTKCQDDGLHVIADDFMLNHSVAPD